MRSQGSTSTHSFGHFHRCFAACASTCARVWTTSVTERIMQQTKMVCPAIISRSASKSTTWYLRKCEVHAAR